MAVPSNLPKRGNIQGLWHLDEESGTRADESGNGNTLADNATVLFGVGKIGNGGDFERSQNEFLSITDGAQSGLDFTGRMTIALWANQESITINQGHYLADKADFGTTVSWGLTMQDNGGGNNFPLFFVSNDGSATTQVVGDTHLTAGTLRHLVGVYNGTDLRVYVNGLLDCTPITYSSGVFDSASPFHIGARGEPQDYWDGIIDEVIIWDTDLSASEVLAVSNITEYTYTTGNFFIFLSEAYQKGKKYFEKKNGLYLPVRPKGILVPEGI